MGISLKIVTTEITKVESANTSQMKVQRTKRKILNMSRKVLTKQKLFLSFSILKSLRPKTKIKRVMKKETMKMKLVKRKKKKGEEAGEEENASKDMPDGAEDEKAKKAEKRKALVDNVLDINAAGPSAKKGRMDPFPQGAGTSSTAMTITELLRKMKSKSATDDKDELMPRLVSALKSINPHKQRVKGTMYLSLRNRA